jgi:hypothetical protein
VQRDAVLARQGLQLRVLADELVQAALEVEPVRDAALQQLAPRGREAAALGRDADDRRGGLEPECLLDGRDDRNAFVCLSCVSRVQDRNGRVGRVPKDPARGLSVVRVAGAALREDQVALP